MCVSVMCVYAHVCVHAQRDIESSRTLKVKGPQKSSRKLISKDSQAYFWYVKKHTLKTFSEFLIEITQLYNII